MQWNARPSQRTLQSPDSNYLACTLNWVCNNFSTKPNSTSHTHPSKVSTASKHKSLILKLLSASAAAIIPANQRMSCILILHAMLVFASEHTHVEWSIQYCSSKGYEDRFVSPRASEPLSWSWAGVLCESQAAACRSVGFSLPYFVLAMWLCLLVCMRVWTLLGSTLSHQLIRTSCTIRLEMLLFGCMQCQMPSKFDVDIWNLTHLMTVIPSTNQCMISSRSKAHSFTKVKLMRPLGCYHMSITLTSISPGSAT